jgi:MoxR-like ATPase
VERRGSNPKKSPVWAYLQQRADAIGRPLGEIPLHYQYNPESGKDLVVNAVVTDGVGRVPVTGDVLQRLDSIDVPGLRARLTPVAFQQFERFADAIRRSAGATETLNTIVSATIVPLGSPERGTLSVNTNEAMAFEKSWLVGLLEPSDLAALADRVSINRLAMQLGLKADEAGTESDDEDSDPEESGASEAGDSAAVDVQDLPSLERSNEITRQAITQLVAGPFPATVVIDGRAIGVKATPGPARAHVTMSWANAPGTGAGGAHLRVGLVTASNQRRNPEDVGHQQSLQVWSEAGDREMGWFGFEWAVRDAIRDRRRNVRVALANSFYERQSGGDDGGSNADLGRRARELCGRSGLGDATRVEIGTYDIVAGTWEPDPTTMLERILTVSLVKTVLRDRGRGELIEGAAPFAASSTSIASTPPPGPSAERLAGVHLWFGSGSEQMAGVREALRFIAEEQPDTDALEGWIREKGELVHKRLDIYTRPLQQLGLAVRDEHDRWALTNIGAELVESASGDILYSAFVAHYVGFEETLAFYGRHPEGDAQELLLDLNARLDTDWTVTAQPVRRAYWLRAMGMLEGERGAWRLSPRGRTLFDALPGALRRALAGKVVDPGPETAPPEAARLSPAFVSLGDLLVEDALIARCCAALNAGKHLLLIGPPGTGKSVIGRALAQHAADVHGLQPPMLATASADWTAYDTMGGWTPRSDGHGLVFRPGVLVRALERRCWLVLDELNRADVDKCLGEMFTVLAGGEAETPFTHPDGSVVRIGAKSVYDPGQWFRLIATMNVRDKATLFRLSYALLRRFAVIEIPVPDDATLEKIAAADAKRIGVDQRYAELAASIFLQKAGLGQLVPLGAAMLRDVLSYVKQRGASELAVAEGVELFVLPQLDGLETTDAKKAHEILKASFISDSSARDHALRCLAAYFPHAKLSG